MTRIKFITDSASDVPKKYAREKNIDVLPFHIYFRDNKIDSNEYLDGVDIGADKLFEIVEKGGGSPNSSQITQFEIEHHMRELVGKNEYDVYIFTAISSIGSPTYNNLVNAKKNMEKDGIHFELRIIDSKSYTACYYYTIKAGIEAYEAGKSVDEICDIMNQRAENTEIYLVAESLEYLKRGGRITGASAAVGTLLDIKPILTVSEGLVAPHEKVRGMKKALARIIEIAKEKTAAGEYLYSIIYSTKTEALDTFVKTVKEEFNLSDIDVLQVGTTIGVHIGPGLIGLLFQKEIN